VVLQLGPATQIKSLFPHLTPFASLNGGKPPFKLILSTCIPSPIEWKFCLDILYSILNPPQADGLTEYP
jgi:hypothetical protein